MIVSAPAILLAVPISQLTSYDGKKISILEPKLEISTFGWSYYVDADGIANILDQGLNSLEMSNAEANQVLNSTQIAFMLFEPEDRMLNGFQTSINLTIESSLDGRLRLADYANGSARAIQNFMKNVSNLSVNAISIKGSEYYAIEYEFDSPTLLKNGNYVRCHVLSYTTISGGKAYTFSGVSSAEAYKVKKQAILMIMGSLVKK